NRVRRIRGQLAAVERGLEEEWEPHLILQTVTACRGALNGLSAQIIEGHVRLHVLDPKGRSNKAQQEAAEQLIEVIRTYLK
ncbi:MAG: metal/formaldehyde-sensitive transcriptional repressor, partial [Candidatus Hydrogenedentes bacterium]|nr:metal/formaldehyde-sensitive transcriptional repressor [Candidatus Hydrogenedentota bacterium]